MSLSGMHLSFLQNPVRQKQDTTTYFYFVFGRIFTMIDLHKEDEKLFALVGACQRDVLLRSSPLEKLL